MHALSDDDFTRLVQLTEGYSGADMNNLVKAAALGPVRSLQETSADFMSIDIAQMRPIELADFEHALREVSTSVDPQTIRGYEEWNEKFGVKLPAPEAR